MRQDEFRVWVDQQRWFELSEQAQQHYALTHEPWLLPLQAMACAQLGQAEAARHAVARAEAVLDQLDTVARVDLAAVYLLAHAVDKAAPLLEAAVQAMPSYSVALSRLAVCRLLQRDAVSSRVLLASALRADSRRVAVWLQYLRQLLTDVGTAQLAEQASLRDDLAHGLVEAALQLETVRSQLPADIADRWSRQLESLQLAFWIEQGEFARAENWIDEQSNALPEEAWTELVAAYAALLASRGKPDTAEEGLRKALRKVPGHAVLTLQIVELSRLQGQHRQVIGLLTRAIEKDEDNPALWTRLSGAWLQHDHGRARKAAEKAIELTGVLQPDEQNGLQKILQLHLQAKLALAHVETDMQRFDEADRIYQEVIKEQPHFLPALQALGQQELQRGHIEQAVSLFEKIKAIDPVAGHTALINARQMPDDPQVLERMERTARTPSLEGPVRTGILFQLAAAWEKRKDYARAFALVSEANEASKKLLRYDTKAHRNRCARIRARFSKELFEHRHDCGNDSTLPVFVLGMPRSGTTLVEQIIAGHSQVFGAGELSVVPQVIAGLERWERHTGSGRHYPDCVDDISPEVARGIAAHVLSELREYDAEAKHVVDKLPHNFENIGLIKFLFPKAKIISMRRDPRDIAISNYFTDFQAKHGGMGFAYDLTWIGEQLADHNLLMHHWHQLFPGEILEVNYEDVVEDTEGMARRMLDYLGLPWEAQVLNTTELDRPVKTASVWQVRQPIYKTSKAKWMNYAWACAADSGHEREDPARSHYWPGQPASTWFS